MIGFTFVIDYQNENHMQIKYIPNDNSGNILIGMPTPQLDETIENVVDKYAPPNLNNGNIKLQLPINLNLIPVTIIGDNDD